MTGNISSSKFVWKIEECVFHLFPHRKQKREQTEPEHRFIDFAGRLLTQKSRVVTLDGKQRHDPLKAHWTR